MNSHNEKLELLGKRAGFSIALQFTLVVAVLVVNLLVPLPKELFWVMVVAVAYILPGLYFLPGLMRAGIRPPSKEELHTHLYGKGFFMRPMTYDEHLAVSPWVERLKRWDRILGCNAFLWPIWIFSSHWRWFSVLAPAAFWSLTTYLYTSSSEAAAVMGVICGLLGWGLHVTRKPFLTAVRMKDEYLNNTYRRS